MSVSAEHACFTNVFGCRDIFPLLQPTQTKEFGPSSSFHRAFSTAPQLDDSMSLSKPTKYLPELRSLIREYLGRENNAGVMIAFPKGPCHDESLSCNINAWHLFVFRDVLPALHEFD